MSTNQHYRQRLLNKSEERVYDEIIKNNSIPQCRIVQKIRIADVIPIQNSGIRDELYSYALKAHFDFVIYDNDLNAEFVIEFNGPSHAEPQQRHRDNLKIELCERFEMPILQINDKYIQHSYRDNSTLLS